MVDKLRQTQDMLAKAREQHDAVVVGFSGGKDSLAILDLCVRVFPRVECFLMELVPGLRIVTDRCAEASKRWGVKIHRLPHWIVPRLIKFGAYCDPPMENGFINEWRVGDAYDAARGVSGIPLVAIGARATDGIWRRKTKGRFVDDDLIYPVWGWSTAHVHAYLGLRGIPVPDAQTKDGNGIDLTIPSLTFLHDHYPDDFERINNLFHYAEVAIWRRHFFEGGPPPNFRGACDRYAEAEAKAAQGAELASEPSEDAGSTDPD